jgi:prolyl-tRNA editing enzyme YbaK/EbsC (Cys-tRNA(Pro) deacylase)
MVENHPAVSRVREVFRENSLPFTMRVFEEGTHTAVAAAEALGVELGQIASSIVFKLIVDGEDVPLLVITSGQHKVDTAKVAQYLGVEKLHRADAEFVRNASGFAIGGVAPVGWTHKPRAIIDTALQQFLTIWAAAGHPYTVFQTSYAELQTLAEAEPLDVGQN